MKIKYDFNLSLWIQGVEVEGKDEDDCFENFKMMTLEDLINEGYVKDMETTDIDQEIVEETVTYKVYNIEWEEEAPQDLPTETELTVELEEGNEEDAITDALRDKFEYWPILFDYKRI